MIIRHVTCTNPRLLWHLISLWLLAACGAWGGSRHWIAIVACFPIVTLHSEHVRCPGPRVLPGPGDGLADYLANLGAIFTRVLIIIIIPNSHNNQQCQHRNTVLAETQYTAPGLRTKMERRKRNEFGSPLLWSVAWIIVYIDCIGISHQCFSWV